MTADRVTQHPTSEWQPPLLQLCVGGMHWQAAGTTVQESQSNRQQP